MKKMHKLCSFVAAASLLLCSFGFSAAADTENYLNEDFESFSGQTIDITEAGNPTGWSFSGNEKYDEFSASVKPMENDDSNMAIEMKMSGNNRTGGNHQKVVKNFSAEGLEGRIIYKFRYWLPEEMFTYDTGEIQVNLEDSNGTEMIAFYIGRNNANGTHYSQLRYVGTTEENGELIDRDAAGTIASTLPVEQWVDVTCTVDTAAKKFFCTVEVDGAQVAEIPEAEAKWCRNAAKSNYNGKPSRSTIYIYRTTKNALLYVDNISVDLYIDPSVQAVQEDRDALTLDGIIDDINQVSSDFTLPLTGSINASTITWSSNNAAVSIDEFGNATVTRGEETQTVVLTATLTNGSASATKEFTIQVLPKSNMKPAPLVQAPVYTLVSGDSETEISAPTTGFVNTAVTVDQAGESGATSVNLIVASVNKTTGAIEALATDTEEVASANRSVELKTGVDFDASTCNYLYYVLDSNGASLKNAAPGQVKNVQATAGVSSLQLQWELPSDDYDSIKAYEVRRDGELLATTEIPSFSESGLEEATEYTYEITAIDHGDLRSAPLSFTAVTAESLYVVLDGEEQADIDAQSQYIEFIVNNEYNTGDSYSEYVEKGGKGCRQTLKRDQHPTNKGMTYLYFDAHESKITENDRTVTIAVEYFDEGSGELRLQYNGVVPTGGDPLKDNIAVNATMATLTNSGEWKTATITLTDAQFRQPSTLTNSDFRLTGTDSPIFVHKVTASVG